MIERHVADGDRIGPTLEAVNSSRLSSTYPAIKLIQRIWHGVQPIVDDLDTRAIAALLQKPQISALRSGGAYETASGGQPCRGDPTIIDFYLGRGTTAITVIRAGRKFIDIGDECR